MTDKNFQNSELWQKAADLAEDMFTVSRGIMDASLRTQITSSAVLVPFRIGESYGRESLDETNRCLVQAKEPLDDLRSVLNECRHQGFLKAVDHALYDEKCGELQAAIHQLISRSSQDAEDKTGESNGDESASTRGAFI